MNEVEPTIITSVAPYVFSMLAVAMALAVLRLMKGPTLPDRVVALDLIALITIGFIATNILHRQEPAFLNAAAVLALVVFLGALAFVRYLEKRGDDG